MLTRRQTTFRGIAACQVTAGGLLAGTRLWAAAHGAGDGLAGVVAESVATLAIVAGIQLWRGDVPGLGLSCAVQALQAVALYTPRAELAIGLGPQATFYLAFLNGRVNATRFQLSL